jgi:hypothetical protein
MAAEINLPATSVRGAVPAPVQGPVVATPVTQRYRAPGVRRPGPALWGSAPPSGRPLLRPARTRQDLPCTSAGDTPHPRVSRGQVHDPCGQVIITGAVQQRSTATCSRSRQPQRTPAPAASWDGSQTRSGAASSGRRGRRFKSGHPNPGHRNGPKRARRTSETGSAGPDRGNVSP